VFRPAFHRFLITLWIRIFASNFQLQHNTWVVKSTAL
jgi:hypothetical protein